MNGESAQVYILHFDQPYWKTCQHYVGYTRVGVDERLKVHRAGNGSKLVKYAMNHGINFSLVKVEDFDSIGEARQRERQIKKRGGGGKLCPICNRWRAI